ncbi:RIO kinase 1 [Strigomonas culicis]|uniref:non-specific serine/threonine protein kinase n=1 Tax=Strigomonas culicis TaxID=28005 RepID=S9V1H8_9TRYP|nr:RIO kinase 1 [Strigomonas culicis]|eukprot:EPY20751.1 RIO kinase 1 [Strigomonas culicis]
MVRTWAEKEARNLMRLQQGGVIAPAVKLLRQHVLVMEFLGEDGWPAPRLKEVRFPSAAALDQCYLDLCATMRKMYSRCRLIHGDLSEYNLLLYRGRVVVIDVSQSVEHDHPRAMDFLRRDIVNVNAFFRAKGHQELFSLQDLFFFITAAPDSKGWRRNQGPDNTPELLLRLKEMREEMHRAGHAVTDENQAKIDEQVFLNIAVPRSLNEVADHKAPNEEVAPFVKGMTADHADAHDDREDDREASDDADDADAPDEDGSDGDEEDDEEDDEEGEEGKKKRKKKNVQKTLSDMTKDEKKAHHKAVKEANRERRQEKKKKGITKYAKKKK